MSGYCVIILRRKQGGKKMTLQQILEEVKKGQLSVEHDEDLLKKEGYGNRIINHIRKNLFYQFILMF